MRYAHEILCLLIIVSLSSCLSQTKVDVSDDEVSAIILDEGFCGPNLKWRLYDDGLLRISGHGTSYDYVKGVLIGKTRQEIEDYPGPAYYGFQEGKNYDYEHEQYVAPWYKYRNEVDFEEYTTKEQYDKYNPQGWKYTKVQIDRGITYIGDWMFYRCCADTLFIPEGVEEIADWGIRYSPTLKVISIPSSVKKIGNNGISRNIEANIIELGDGLEEIGDNALGQNSKVKQLILPSSLKSIGGHSLMADYQLEIIELGSIAEIPERTLINAHRLKSIVIPQTVTRIDEYAFYDCPELDKVVISANVQTISDNAFLGCSALENVYIDSQQIANKINENTTSNGYLTKNAKHIYINKSITCPFAEATLVFDGEEGEYKRYSQWSEYQEPGLISAGILSPGVYYKIIDEDENNENGYTLMIGSNTTGIYSGNRQCAFYSQKDKITKIIIDNNVNITTSDFFNGYENLIEAEIGITDIPKNFFLNCYNLRYLTLRDGVKIIGSYAFFNTSITNLIIPDSVVSIADRAAFNTKAAYLENVTIGCNVKEIGELAFMNYTNVKIPENNKLEKIGPQAFFSNEGGGVLYLPNIQYIGSVAFYHATDYSIIRIGHNIETIGDNAFASHQGIVYIEKEKSQVNIGNNAFGKGASVFFEN